MNKSELSSRVAADASLSKAGADSVIDAVFSTITASRVTRSSTVAASGRRPRTKTEPGSVIVPGHGGLALCADRGAVRTGSGGDAGFGPALPFGAGLRRGKRFTVGSARGIAAPKRARPACSMRVSRRVPSSPARAVRPSGAGTPMTRSALIERMARKHRGLAERDVELAVKMMLEQMTACFAGGGRIEIRGFGSFTVRFRPARIGRNPATGTAVALPARYAPHFKPGKKLRERLNRERRAGGSEV